MLFVSFLYLKIVVILQSTKLNSLAQVGVIAVFADKMRCVFMTQPYRRLGARRCNTQNMPHISQYRRRLPFGNGGDCRRRKTPHRAPPCEELDPPYDIKLVFLDEVTLILGNSTKPAAT